MSDVRTWGVDDRFEAIEECEWQMVDRRDYDAMKSRAEGAETELAAVRSSFATASERFEQKLQESEAARALLEQGLVKTYDGCMDPDWVKGRIATLEKAYTAERQARQLAEARLVRARDLYILEVGYDDIAEEDVRETKDYDAELAAVTIPEKGEK